MSALNFIEAGLGAELQVIGIVLSIMFSLIFFASDFRIGMLTMFILNGFLLVFLSGIGVTYQLVVFMLGFCVCILAISFYFSKGQMGVSA